MIRIIIIIVFGIANISNAQETLRSPINYKIKLSGSFGELRTNHFHSGIDIRSSGNWAKNKAISVMDGYVSRIRIGPSGYGNAIYINHPNGLTSVYAHLYSFNDKITKVARRIQFENKSFSINPDSLHIPVKKGEIIGQIGNTGRSFGTHLHFELRHTETEHPVNPFKYNIKPKDTRRPVFSRLKIVALDKSLNVLNSKKYKLKKNKSGNYTTIPSVLNYGAWRVGFELLGFDRMNGSKNKNGIYSLTMFVDSKKVYSFKIDSLDFSTQRDINAHIDYREFLKNKQKYNRLYVLPRNDLDIYNFKSNEAIVSLYENRPQNVEIIAKDFDGNTTKLNFKIKRDVNIIESEPKLYNQILEFGKEYTIQHSDYYMQIDSNALYKNMHLFLSSNDNNSEKKYSEEIVVFTNYEIFKKSVKLYIRPLIIDSLYEKIFVAKVDGKKIVNFGNKYEDGYFRTNIKTSGTFKLMIDTIPPTIKPIRFKKRSTSYSKLAFIIKDNFDSGGISFDGYIDDQWVLLEYDLKKKRITHRFDKSLSKGKHQFKLIVKDSLGNTSVFEKEILR